MSALSTFSRVQNSRFDCITYYKTFHSPLQYSKKTVENHLFSIMFKHVVTYMYSMAYVQYHAFFYIRSNVLPLLLNMLECREYHVRLVLLQYLHSFCYLCSKEDLCNVVLPEVRKAFFS